jgi:phage N-6-adenine-methyltransferase
MGATLNRGKSKQDYQTPAALIDAALDRLCLSTFTWDLAATADNKKAPFFYSEQDDSLAQDWDACGGWLWCNPPYNDITPWVEKAAATTESYIAMLLPASVGSNWWRDHVHHRAHVLLLNGRVPFMPDKPKWLYPKDCALLLYTPFIKYGSYEVWSWK